VYDIEDGGRRSLWLRQVATGTDVRLTEPENIGYFGLTISPDGKRRRLKAGRYGTSLTRAARRDKLPTT